MKTVYLLLGILAVGMSCQTVSAYYNEEREGYTPEVQVVPNDPHHHGTENIVVNWKPNPSPATEIAEAINEAYDQDLERQKTKAEIERLKAETEYWRSQSK